MVNKLIHVSITTVETRKKSKNNSPGLLFSVKKKDLFEWLLEPLGRGAFGRQVAIPSLFSCPTSWWCHNNGGPGLFEILLSLIITFPCFRGICADKEKIFIKSKTNSITHHYFPHMGHIPPRPAMENQFHAITLMWEVFSLSLAWAIIGWDMFLCILAFLSRTFSLRCVTIISS